MLKNASESAMRTERLMSCSEAATVPSDSGGAHHRVVGHGGGAGQPGQKVDIVSDTLSEVVAANTSFQAVSGRRPGGTLAVRSGGGLAGPGRKVVGHQIVGDGGREEWGEDQLERGEELETLAPHVHPVRRSN